MNPFEHYKERIAEGLEEVWGKERSETVSENGLSEELENILGPDRSKFERFVAFLKVADKFLPERVKKSYREGLYNESNLPFNFEKLGFDGWIGKGGESTVYLLESKNKEMLSYVLKIHVSRKTGGAEELLSEAKRYKEEYETIKSWYAEMPDLIPEENFLICPKPLNGKPAVASVQKFVGRKLKDIFDDISKDNLEGICSENPGLAESIKKFVAISDNLKKEKGEIVDLLGKKNLSIAEDEDGKEKLVFIDPHISFSKDRNKTEEKLYKRAESRLDYLDGVADDLALARL